MSDHTAIEWTDATWNPIVGCSVVSPGCTNCYAMKLAGTRLAHTAIYAGLTQASKARPVWNGQVRLIESALEKPLHWAKPRRIFVNSMGDLFHEAIPDEWIDACFAVMERCPQHTFQVLTKRARRLREYSERQLRRALTTRGKPFPPFKAWPLSNVWLGVSAEDQTRWDERVPELIAAPARVRFVSAEPLLSRIDASDVELARLHWLIVGGESGPGSRPMQEHWASILRDRAKAAGAAFFFKQWGDWRDGARVGKTKAGRELLGRTHDTFPEPMP